MLAYVRSSPKTNIYKLVSLVRKLVLPWWYGLAFWNDFLDIVELSQWVNLLRWWEPDFSLLEKEVTNMEKGRLEGSCGVGLKLEVSAWNQGVYLHARLSVCVWFLVNSSEGPRSSEHTSRLALHPHCCRLHCCVSSASLNFHRQLYSSTRRTLAFPAVQVTRWHVLCLICWTVFYLVFTPVGILVLSIESWFGFYFFRTLKTSLLCLPVYTASLESLKTIPQDVFSCLLERPA